MMKGKKSSNTKPRKLSVKEGKKNTDTVVVVPAVARKRKTCIEEGCKIGPSYNLNSETKPIYCLLHKKELMVNVRSKKCLGDECLKRPSYNFDGEISAIFCSIHKEKGMVDITSKHCIEEGCRTHRFVICFLFLLISQCIFLTDYLFSFSFYLFTSSLPYFFLLCMVNYLYMSCLYPSFRYIGILV